MWKILLVIGACTFFIFIGGYIELTYSVIKRFNIIDEYPTIVVGVSAAIAALIGVVVSQICQTTNLKLQHKNAVSLKNIELDEQRNQKKHEEVTDNNREFYTTLIVFIDVVDEYWKHSYEYHCARTEFNLLLKLPKNQDFIERVDNLRLILKELMKDVQAEKQKYREMTATIKYLHEVKGVGDSIGYTIFTSSMEKIVNLMMELDQFSSVIKNKDEVYIQREIMEKGFQLYLKELMQELNVMNDKYFELANTGEYISNVHELLNSVVYKT